MTRAYLDLPERPRFATLKTFPRALRLYPPGNEAMRAWGNIEGEKEGGGHVEIARLKSLQRILEKGCSYKGNEFRFSLRKAKDNNRAKV